MAFSVSATTLHPLPLLLLLLLSAAPSHHRQTTTATSPSSHSPFSLTAPTLRLPQSPTPRNMLREPAFCRRRVPDATSLPRTSPAVRPRAPRKRTTRLPSPARASRKPRVARVALAAALHLSRNRTFHRLARLQVDRANATAISLDGPDTAIHLSPIWRARACAPRRPRHSVTVYVIDTGCRISHAQLAGRAVAVPAPGSKFASGDDDHGHGTHVAARIAGKDFGLAPNARVVCIKALSRRNEGSSADVLSAIAHAVRLHRRAANLERKAYYTALARRWGDVMHAGYGRRWSRKRDGASSAALISVSLGVAAAARYTELDRAVSRAAHAGLVSVVAAGNSARDACDFTPARAAGAIAVAATHADGRLAAFSNRGPCVTVGAPGVDVWSAVGGADDVYGVSSGTSMAAPFVSGIAALMLADRGPMRAREIAAALQDMAEWRYGLGVVSTAGFCRWMRTERERSGAGVVRESDGVGVGDGLGDGENEGDGDGDADADGESEGERTSSPDAEVESAMWGGWRRWER